MISFKQHGEFKKTQKFLEKSLKFSKLSDLDKYAKLGLKELISATPIDSGLTASSWDYVIERTKEGAKIIWTNSNINDGVNIAVIIQYGHGTGTGAYVEGIDYINPAIRSVFEEITDDIRKEVSM